MEFGSGLSTSSFKKDNDGDDMDGVAVARDVSWHHRDRGLQSPSSTSTNANATTTTTTTGTSSVFSTINSKRTWSNGKIVVMLLFVIATLLVSYMHLSFSRSDVESTKNQQQQQLSNKLKSRSDTYSNNIESMGISKDSHKNINTLFHEIQNKPSEGINAPLVIVGDGGIFYCKLTSDAFRGFAYFNNVEAKGMKTEHIRNILNSCKDTSTLTLLTNPTIDSYDVFTKKMCSLMLEQSVALSLLHMKQKNPMDCCPNAWSSYLSLSFALDNYELDTGPKSLWLEFGVNKGYSINVTSFFRQKKDSHGEKSRSPIHGFDSFLGLPRGFIVLNQGSTKTSKGGAKVFASSMKAGMFTQNGTLPPVRNDILLHKGWFNETLPAFFNDLKDDLTVGWLSIDNDLYEGAMDILDLTIPRFTDKTIIHFHELLALIARDRKSIAHLPIADVCLANEEMRALYDSMRKVVHKDLKLQILQFSNAEFFEPVVFKVFK